MLSAPAHIPAITVVSFGAGLADPDLILGSAMSTFSANSGRSPVCSANVITGTSPAHGNLACRLSGGAGGDAIIDNHGNPPRQRDSVTPAAEAFCAASQFDPLLAFDRVHVVAVEVCLAHDVVVEYPHAVLADGAEGQFRLIRHTELAHHKHVERGPQCLGDLEGHRHTASR